MTCGYMRSPQYPSIKQECVWANAGFSLANFLHTAMPSLYYRAKM
jgi:hypothetical protein